MNRHAVHVIVIDRTRTYPFSSHMSHWSFFMVGIIARLGPHHPGREEA
jgi:hypothetical protein